MPSSQGIKTVPAGGSDLITDKGLARHTAMKDRLRAPVKSMMKENVERVVEQGEGSKGVN